ncbi:MAG: secondary thiamine-phosphate synthase enzyme YjbQ [Bradymonadales bacterium]
MVEHYHLRVSTRGRRTYEITRDVSRLVRESGIKSGLCTLFIRHCSASLLINENADSSVQRDLWRFLEKLAPDNDPDYEHIYEGSDDMPAHIKSALLAVSLSIPIMDGALALGTWQGIYLWEHRVRAHERTVIVTVVG